MDAYQLYSTYPTEIMNWEEKYDPQQSDMADILRFQNLKTKTYLTPEEQVELNNLTTKLKNKIFTSQDLNKIGSNMVSMQVHYRDNTVGELNKYKQELRTYSESLQILTQRYNQQWVTTAKTDYDIYSGGTQSLPTGVEIKTDSTAEIDIYLDGILVGYSDYTIVANSSGKKTIIRFKVATAVGKKLEARWAYNTSANQILVSSHQHLKTDITDLPNVAKTGAYNDLTGIPTSFTPSSHAHAWGEVTGKPATYTPSAHTHDDRYYTESEINTKLTGKSDAGHKHNISDVNGLQGEIDNLKSSVVSGKQLIVNALNDKHGYNTGLTINNTFNDYAWSIGQIQKANIDNTAKIVINMAANHSSNLYENGITNSTLMKATQGSLKTVTAKTGDYVFGSYRSANGMTLTKIQNGGNQSYLGGTYELKDIWKITSGSGNVELSTYSGVLYTDVIKLLIV